MGNTLSCTPMATLPLPPMIMFTNSVKNATSWFSRDIVLLAWILLHQVRNVWMLSHNMQKKCGNSCKTLHTLWTQSRLHMWQLYLCHGRYLLSRILPSGPWTTSGKKHAKPRASPSHERNIAPILVCWLRIIAFAKNTMNKVRSL